jgi:hypothetical protein
MEMKKAQKHVAAAMESVFLRHICCSFGKLYLPDTASQTTP